MNTPEHKPDDGLELPIEIYASDYKRLTRLAEWEETPPRRDSRRRPAALRSGTQELTKEGGRRMNVGILIAGLLLSSLLPSSAQGQQRYDIPGIEHDFPLIYYTETKGADLSARWVFRGHDMAEEIPLYVNVRAFPTHEEAWAAFQAAWAEAMYIKLIRKKHETETLDLQPVPTPHP
jgi:hypothetical protein